MQKSHPKMVNPRDIAGGRGGEKDKEQWKSDKRRRKHVEEEPGVRVQGWMGGCSIWLRSTTSNSPA